MGEPPHGRFFASDLELLAFDYARQNEPSQTNALLVKRGMNIIPVLQQFRQSIYHALLKRADATLDLLDALTVAGHVASPVSLSEESPFRRKFSSVFDVLTEGQIDGEALHTILAAQQPADCQQIAGFEVYAVDTTPDEREEAETLEGRCLLKAQKNAPVRVGQKFSWLVRLVKEKTSWVAPWDVRRVKADSSDNLTAVEQVKELDAQNQRPKVVVADSLYANQVFLAVFLMVQTIAALVRMRSNITLYEQPTPKPAGSRGAPRKHGPTFKMDKPSREPDRCEMFFLGLQQIRLSAWRQLHLRKLPKLIGLVLRVEFLKPDGTLRYQRPMWLFWTGPEAVSLQDLCRMYLWRFAIEHAFRFMKQHFGLNAHCQTDNDAIQRWMWLCALAYWQLLLMGQDVEDLCPAWYPRKDVEEQSRLTPGQVQRGARRFIAKLGTPAAAPKPAGKGRGRAKGYHPKPRKRYEVVRKSQKPAKRASATAPSGV